MALLFLKSQKINGVDYPAQLLAVGLPIAIEQALIQGGDATAVGASGDPWPLIGDFSNPADPQIYLPNGTKQALGNGNGSGGSYTFQLGDGTAEWLPTGGSNGDIVERKDPGFRRWVYKRTSGTWALENFPDICVIDTRGATITHTIAVAGQWEMLYQSVELTQYLLAGGPHNNGKFELQGKIRGIQGDGAAAGAKQFAVMLGTSFAAAVASSGTSSTTGRILGSKPSGLTAADTGFFEIWSGIQQKNALIGASSQEICYGSNFAPSSTLTASATAVNASVTMDGSQDVFLFLAGQSDTVGNKFDVSRLELNFRRA